MRRDGGPVFPAHANPGDPNGPFEACPLMRTHHIHDGREHKPLQAEAGLMQDRNANRSTKPLATHGRTIHVGHSRHFHGVRGESAPPPIFTVKADIADRQLGATNGNRQKFRQGAYSRSG